eukprot:Skav235922  [mRNA]  locus=scaffold2493:107451:110625:+ [translate_table: standard]
MIGDSAAVVAQKMAATTGLEPLVETQISVVTNDGRLFVGVLRGFDQSSNVVLSDCQERVFDTEKGVEQVVLGLYVIRGDNLAPWSSDGVAGKDPPDTMSCFFL